MSAKIDHIGIAVGALGDRLAFWRDALGLTLEGTERVESEQVEVAFLRAGEARIELLQPTDPKSPIARHVAKRGEGIHHLTLRVGDLEHALARVRDAGVEVLGDGPRAGAEGTRVAFLHPRSCGGVLVELVERPRGERVDDLVPGRAILAYLRDPQEKIFGVLRRIDASGVVLEGVDLSSFDDWIAEVDRGEETIVGPSVVFVPMTRVERLLLDRPSGNLPSLSDRFRTRTGRTVGDVLGT